MLPNVTSTASAAARFGSTYGYRFNGDSVELHATFQLLNDSAHQLRWALQLRASPVAFAITEPLVTHLVAESSLPPLAEIAGTSEPFFLTVPATPPAGSGEFNLHLVLVTRDATLTEEVHDVARFARPEIFVQPRFTGEVAYLLSGDKIHLTVAALENPRDPANLTGTLALELWALTKPYNNGSFQGTHLAGVAIGNLAGQQSWYNLAYDLAFTPPSVGRWHLALMLREWTGTGYTTRDYYNFALPFVIEAAVPASPEPVVEAAKPAPKPESTAKAELTPAPKVIVAPATKKAAAPVKAPAKAAKTSKPATGVSINHATDDELAAVKGITKTAVTAIIAGRPYATIEQLAKVKGVGTKTLAKIRSSLAL
jgi:competence ComEA-like helix-hairpin-helix protein